MNYPVVLTIRIAAVQPILHEPSGCIGYTDNGDTTAPTSPTRRLYWIYGLRRYNRAYKSHPPVVLAIRITAVQLLQVPSADFIGYAKYTTTCVNG